VQRHFVIEDANTATNHRVIILARRPGKAESRRGIHLARDPLIFEANSEIEREVGTHQQTILNETDIFAISRIDWLWRAKDNSLRQRPVLPDDIDGAC